MSQTLIAISFVIVLVLIATYFFAPGPTADFLLMLERSSARLHDRRIQAAGLEIAYLDGGQGETLLLLHGFGADRFNWPRMVRNLDGKYRVVAPDLPGFGASTRDPALTYDVASQVERLHAFVLALDLERFHIAGNSMGGHIAALYAATHPDRVRSILLMNAAGVMPPDQTPFMRGLETGRNLLIADSRADFDALMALVFVREPWIPGPVRASFERVAIERSEWLAKVFADYLAAYVALEEHLASVSAPALILWGDQDHVLSPSSVGILSALLPDSSTVVLDDTGHLPMLERPGETARVYEEFLRAVRQRPDYQATP